MLNLAWAYLRDRPLTTFLNVLLLAISVAMLILLLQFGSQAKERFERDAEGIDLVVGAKGSPLQLILSSIFHIDQPTGNIPVNSLTMLRRDPAVAQVVPLALGDNFDGYRIVGTDKSFLDLHGAELAQGKVFAEPMQAIMGAQVAEITGALPGQKFFGSHGLTDDSENDYAHDSAPFETVGILAPTGTVIDRLIITPFESVWQVHGIAHHDEDGHEGAASHSDHDAAETQQAHSDNQNNAQASPGLQERRNELEPELTALLVSYRNASGAIRIPAMINRQTEMQAAVPAVETTRLLDLLGASLDGARIFAWLLAATGGLAIFVALLNMTRSREGDLALLRVMGATKGQVFRTVIFEGVLTAAAGVAAGWLAAHAGLALAGRSSPTLRELGLRGWNPAPEEAIIILGVLTIGAVAALVPAWRVFRLDPVRTLSRSA